MSGDRDGGSGLRELRGERPGESIGGGHLAALSAREFAELQSGVTAHVRASFGGSLSEQDLEDVVQESCAAAIKRVQGGGAVENLPGFLRDVAWREARAILRSRRPAVSLDAATGSLDRMLASRTEESAHERVAARGRLARAAEALDQLTPEERGAYRARFIEGLDSSEACRRLGMKRSTYFTRIQTASDHVSAAVWADSLRFTELERELLNAYVEGRAHGRVRRRAERLIAFDPDAAVLATALRRSHELAAATLPPLTVDQTLDVGIFERLGAIGGRAKDAVGSALSRGETEVATSSILTSGGTRGAGTAATGGLLAKLGLSGGAAKVAIGCVTGGAATVACLATGVISAPTLPGLADPEDEPRVTLEARAKPTPVKPIVPISTLPSQVGHDEPAPVSTKQSSGGDGGGGSEETAPEPAPASEPVVAPTAPVEQQEFGAPAAAVPASGPAPADTKDSDGASAGTVRQEFGP